MGSFDRNASSEERSEATSCLLLMAKGDRQAENRLLTILYDDLRRLAAKFLRDERDGHTLQATALTHEAWLRLVNEREAPGSKRQFFMSAARAMRRVLTDHARRRGVRIEGGQRAEMSEDVLPDTMEISATHLHLLPRLDAALELFAQINEPAAKVVELRYFGGLSVDEAAEILDISASTVVRNWRFARAWLRTQMRA